MRTVTLPRLGFVESWRSHARALLVEGVPPDFVNWRSEGDTEDLLGELSGGNCTLAPVATPSVPAAFMPLVNAALCHSSAERFSIPYRVLWRLQTSRRLLEDRSDPDVAALHAMEKSVRRDAHKMKAFVRFRDLGLSPSGRRRFISWFEPEHHILEATAPFFTRRFADMDWIIAVPGLAACYEEGALKLEISGDRPDLPDDSADDLWRTYYASIFNPARLKVKAMKSEMPVKYWKNLPEARLIPSLIAGAEQAVHAMREAMPTTPTLFSERLAERLPARQIIEPEALPKTLEEARQAASACTRCQLCRHATQTVFGEGAPHSELMVVGEQPGDQEDMVGRPFVGPAGQLFDALLAEAGLEREKTYVTNAVKHFKFEPRGKRRIHMRPNAGEVEHCRWWLDLERTLVRPRLLVALGATAASALTGKGSDIMKRRGTLELSDDGVTPVFLTVHPSSVLRAGTPADQARARALMLEDLIVLRRQFGGTLGVITAQ